MSNNFIKRFTDWFTLKPKLDSRKHKPPHVRIGDIWWCRLGENIGYEISGKSDQFTRPVLIYAKLGKYMYLTIPLSTVTKHKDGKNKKAPWFVNFKHRNKSVVACLTQIRTVDYRRLHNIYGRIDESDMNKITKSFNSLYYKKISSPNRGDVREPEKMY